MSTDLIVYQPPQQGVATVLLNRPQKKNAITLAMYDGLAAAIAAAESDPDVRVLVIAAAGDNFTAGNDLEDFLNQPADRTEWPVTRFLHGIAAARKPLVAAVGGVAIGIGTTLLLHCDLVIASRTARFQLPFVDLGLVPEAASSLLLPRLVGHVRAAELLLLGDAFDADAALAYGLINRVVDPDALLATTTAFAVRLAAKNPASVRHTKALMKAAPTDIVTRMDEEATIFASQLSTPEAKAAFAAFFARRASGRKP